MPTETINEEAEKMVDYEAKAKIDATWDGYYAGLNEEHAMGCPRCLSETGQWRGYRDNRNGRVHRRCCNRCHRWYQVPI